MYAEEIRNHAMRTEKVSFWCFRIESWLDMFKIYFNTQKQALKKAVRILCVYQATNDFLSQELNISHLRSINPQPSNTEDVYLISDDHNLLKTPQRLMLDHFSPLKCTCCSIKAHRMFTWKLRLINSKCIFNLPYFR